MKVVKADIQINKKEEVEIGVRPLSLDDFI
jgi:hypothetical protein